MRRDISGARKVRTFVGIPLRPDVTARLRVVQGEMRVIADRLRMNASWEKPEKMHITLKFLGDVEESRLDELSQALDRISERHRSFALELNGVDGFPAGKAPHIVFVAIGSGAEALAPLAREIDEAAAAVGVARETRPFHGHVTLVRIRRAPKGLRPATLAPAGVAAGQLEVPGFNLYASTIGKEGSVHRVLSHHALIRDIRTDP